MQPDRSGIVAGLLAVAYNRTLLEAIAAADHLGGCPVEARAALVGAAVGIVAPGLVGGGEPITQRTLAGAATLSLLPLAFLLRLRGSKTIRVLSSSEGTGNVSQGSLRVSNAVDVNVDENAFSNSVGNDISVTGFHHSVRLRGNNLHASDGGGS